MGMGRRKSVSLYHTRRLNQRRNCIGGIIGLDDAFMKGIVIIVKLFGYSVRFLRCFAGVTCYRKRVYEIM
jgi:hypothetical protein